MTQQKPNTQSTLSERLRLVLGGVAAFAGFFIVIIVGALSRYSDTTVWIIGLGLIVGGLLLAGSMRLIEALTGFIRW